MIPTNTFRATRLIAYTLLTLLSLVSLTVGVSAQNDEEDIPSLPIDPSVRMGKLENGLTYILRRNEATEKGKAHFYLVEKAGSLQEATGEEGMAHFVEKMALGSTLHFSEHKLEEFLERHGLLSGGKFSTETQYDRTVYRLKDVPTEPRGLTDSVLLVLRDWSGGMIMEPKETALLKELILKGWEPHVTPEVLLKEKVFTALLPAGHPYATRPPYGKKASIERFTPQAVSAFYRKWYRPDLQAVIVAGDINLDEMEDAIDKAFGRLRAGGSDARIEPVSIPELEAPLGVVVSSPVLERSTLTVSWIRKALPRSISSSAASLLRDYYIRLITLMMNERLKDLAFLPEPPFESAEISFVPYPGPATNEEAFRLKALLITGSDYREALKSVVTEVKRAVEHGFTEPEFELAKSRIIKEYNLRFDRLREVSNLHFADKYADYFISGGYIPGIELEQKLIAQVARQVSLKGVNDNLQTLISGPDTSILLTLPESSTGLGTPSGILLAKQYHSYYDKATEPYVPHQEPETLMARPEKKGYLVSEERDLKYGTTVWKLSNGATVYLLPTDHSAGEVLVSGFSEGGFALKDAQTLPLAVRAVNEGILDQLGIGGLTPLDIKKYKDKNNITLSSSIRLTGDRLRGSAVTENVEGLLQLLYLRLSATSFSEKDFMRARNIELKHLRSPESRPSPDTILGDSIQRALYPDQKIFGTTTEQELSKIRLKDFEELYRNHFGNARKFTFFIVGDFDPIKIQPLVETYIGGLPSDFQKPLEKGYTPLGFPKRSRFITIPLDRAYPYAAATNILFGAEKRTLRSIITYDILTELLRQRYAKTVRNEDPTTQEFEIHPYVMETSGVHGSYLSYTIHTDPSNIDRLANNVLVRIKSLSSSGIEEGEFGIALRNLEERHNKSLKKNGYWIDALEGYFINGEEHTDEYVSTLRSITKEETLEALKRLIDHNVLVQIKAVSQGIPVK